MSKITSPHYKNIFEIDSSSNDDFKKIIGVFLDWSQTKLPAKIDDKLYTGANGTFAHGESELDVVSTNGETKYWSARLTHPCGEVDGRKWFTEISFAKLSEDDVWRAGISVSYQNPEHAPNKKPRSSIPGIIRKLHDEIGISLDDQNATDKAMDLRDMIPDVISAQARAGYLIDYLSLPERRHPVVLVADENDEKGPLIDIHLLQQYLFGIAHVIGISRQESFGISDRIGKPLSVYNGAVRIAWPGFSAASDPREHDLFLSNDIRDFDVRFRSPEQHIAWRVASSFMLKLTAEDIPSFSSVKTNLLNAVIKDLKHESAAPPPAEPETQESVAPTEIIEPVSGDELEELRRENKNLSAIIEAQNLKIQEASRQIEEALGLAVAESEEAKRLKLHAAGLSSELEELKGELGFSPKMPSLGKNLFPPISLVGEWADVVFKGRLDITRAARMGAQEADYRYPEYVYQGLIALGGPYREMRAAKDDRQRLSMRNQFNTEIMNIGIEDRVAMRPEFASLYGNTYYASTGDGSSLFMDRHLCKGNARDSKNCLRIYYAWDAKSETVVVGHLPSHLENSIT